MEERVKEFEERMAALEVRIQEHPDIKEIAKRLRHYHDLSGLKSHTFSLPELGPYNHDHTESILNAEPLAGADN